MAAQSESRESYHPRAALAGHVANTLHYRDLPDFIVYSAACDCVQRSIERAAPEAVA